jgi:hypothetical protein
MPMTLIKIKNCVWKEINSILIQWLSMNWFSLFLIILNQDNTQESGKNSEEFQKEKEIGQI